MKRSAISIISALLATTLVVAAGAATAAGGGGSDSKVFGRGGGDLKPLCGKGRDDACQAVGSLTTFINQLDGKKHPFVAPRDGKIVAWSIELGHKPSSRPPSDNPDGKSNLEFFQDLFGNERYGKGPVARLSILKRQGGGIEFKLVDRGPSQKLSGPFYHADTVITLDRPLPIKKGEIVGLTSHTWIPMLKPHQRGDGKNAWRASLNKGDCNENGIINGKPQKKIDTVREYACKFDDRLFYKAWFVAD